MYFYNRLSLNLLLSTCIVSMPIAATSISKPAQPSIELLETISEGSCTSGIGKLYGASSHHYTLANMQNWTNNFLSIAFTNVDHTEIGSVRAYTTSHNASYYNGNGGTFRFHIYSDDGTGKPDRSLAQTPEYIGATNVDGPWSSQSQAQNTYPNAIWSSYGETGKHLESFRRYNLASPLSVTPGTRYHLVMIRTSSVSHGTSLNGHFTGRLAKDDDPTFPAGDWRIHTSSNGSSWSELEHVGIFEVIGNGMTIGNAQHEIAAFSDADRSNNVDGLSAARQVWIPHKTMEIAKLRVQAGRRNGSAALDFEIKGSDGTVFRAGSITGFPVINTGNDVRQTVAKMQRLSTEFTPLQVEAGKRYYIELKTTSGTHYEIGMTRDGVLSGYFTIDPDYHGWGANSTTEVSYDNGSNWSLPTNWGNPRSYLAIEADVGEYADGITTCLEYQ